MNCRWDDELAEVAQIWADQCTGVMYQHHNSGKIEHLKKK